MKRKAHIILLVLLLLCVLSTTAFAIDESEVESAIAASSKEEVAGNVFIWFLCAIGFLKVSQKIDSFMASLGINVGRTGGSMLTELMVAGRGIAAVAGAVGGTVFNHHSSSNSTHTNAQAAGAAFTGGGNGLVGVTRRAAGNAAAASATGNAKGLSNLVGGAMFESSLQNGGKFAMSVVGAVAKGSISSVGSITGDQAAAALTSYLGYSPVDSGSALADDGGLIPPSPITSEDVVTLDGGTAAGTASPTASANGTPIPSGAREHDGSVVESARISGAPPIFQNVEIGGGRITGLEVSPDRQSDREFAMYSTEQYMAPTGPYDTVQTVDGASWYRQYAQPKVEKTPYTDEGDKIRYEERIVSQMPPVPKNLMSDEKSQQQTSTESTVAGAAKTGKAISNIAKGAAAGGAHGAAIEAGKSSAKWLIPLIAAVLLPLILVAMLPSIIFGSLLGDGTDSPNGISNDEVLVQNMTAINEGISSILSEGLTDVLERIDSDFASSGCDGKEINNPFGADVVFNANAFVSQYCAHKDTDIASISKEDMEALLTANKDKLYSFAFTDEEREIPPEQGDEDSGETIHETIRIYTISYNGEAYFADQVFHLSDDQKLLASQYAQNLTVLLGDGIYQGLSETEFSAMGLSYDGVIFADGETQVVYYNQLDERWKYSPYGTDTIGGYACGPTAMAIVISSLTSETIDPPHMAQWAYEHGYWCSGNGSYRSLIPGAAQAWSLSVDGCTASEPQRIIDALAEGKLVVALMTKGHFTSSGHFIVLRGCTSDGKILVADPSSYKRSEKSWDMSIILNEASKRAGSGGPFWIIGN